MSVTIRWRPAGTTSNHFEGGTSTELQALQNAFPRCRIDRDDVRVLRAMSKVGSADFYNEVADIVEQVGVIDFWGEW